MKTRIALVFFTVALCFNRPMWAEEETAFLHQGEIPVRLHPAAVLDLRFRLFEIPAGGTQIGDTVLAERVPTTKGAYSVLLDFSADVFDGGLRWLEVAYRPAGSGAAFRTLPEREPLFPVPAAIHALTANRLRGPLPPAQLPPAAARLDADQTFTGAVAFHPPAGPPFAVGSTSLVANLNADRLDGLDASAFWQLAGNAGTTPGVHFLETTDNRPLELRVNNQRALLLIPGTNAPSLAGGHHANHVAAGAAGAIALGGGGLGLNYFPLLRSNVYPNAALTNHAIVVGGVANTNAGPAGFIGGGVLNQLHPDAWFGFIGAGFSNSIGTNSQASAIVSGVANLIGNSSSGSLILGGWDNSISNSGVASVQGGWRNRIEAAPFSIIGGGFRNTNSRSASFAIIGGGTGNLISTNADAAIIAGGTRNTVRPDAAFASIPGGQSAVARDYGQFAFASGRFAQNGDAQTSHFVLRGVTTNDVPGLLFLDGRTRRISVPADGRWAFDILAVGSTADGRTAGWQLKGVIKNAGGVTSLVGVPAVTPLGADTEAAGWSITVEADAANSALAVRGAGSPGAVVRWVATVRTAELIY